MTHGIDRPTEGLKTRLRTKRYVPVQDVGIVRDVMAGRVRPVAAVQGFTATSVLLALSAWLAAVTTRSHASRMVMK